MRPMRLLAPSVLCFVAALTADQARAADPFVSARGIEVKFIEKTRTFEVSDAQLGPLIERGVVRVKTGEVETSSDDVRLNYRPVVHADRAEMVLTFADVLTVKARINPEGVVELHTDGRFKERAEFQAFATVGPAGIVGILKDDRKTDRGVLITTLGSADVWGAASLFDPRHDLAIRAGSEDWVHWDGAPGWRLHARAPAGKLLVSLRLHRNYYRDELGIKYYAPIRKRPRWQTAPVVAMTWYGIEGWKGRPAQRREWLWPNIDWVAKHLLPYAETLIFQLDDNYPERDDKPMREFSDYIRSKGLVPGIWFTPYTVAPKAETEKHPDWFIHGADGKPISTFGGVSYGGDFTLNVSNPQAVDTWFGMWWRKAGETWNYDFFKIDGQPDVISAYKKSKDGGGVDGYRKGLDIGRSIVGPEKFINGCWGIPLEAIGKVDGSRTGGDTGNDPHAIDMIVRWNYLNNVAWWCDPDAAANLFKATVERTRLNAQARVLTGQQFLTDDVWTKVPPPVRRVWQLSFPTLDIRPVNLYQIEDWKRYDLFDLRVGKPWGMWDVVGLFNYDGKAAEKVIDLNRLPLEPGPTYVFQFWSSTYLGKFDHGAKIARLLSPYEGQVFSMVRAAKDDRPVLISTSRHVSQGGLDLDELSWRQEMPRWIAKGKSSHLVAGDPYELVFAAENYTIASATSDAGKVESLRGGGVLRARITPRQSGSAAWEVVFEPVEKAGLDVMPGVCDLRPGQAGHLEVVSVGPQEVAWKAVASDPRVRVSPQSGRLGPWPARATLSVSADAAGLEPGKMWSGQVTVEAEGALGSPAKAEVRTMVPLPENLALKAKARASSIWASDYRAEWVNDGKDNTRWNPREGDKDGCWIELVWPQPIEFDRVVIDECMDFGPRIQAWHLEAGTERMTEIARGTTMGRSHTIDLGKPVKAKKLRLTIDKASVVPTIWEIEVYRWKRPK